MKGKCYGIGVGPGEAELMTLKSVRLIKEADVIVAPDRMTALNIVKAIVSDIDKKEFIEANIPMTKDSSRLEAAYDELAGKIMSLLDSSKSVAYITLGDVSIYSTYIYLHKILIKNSYYSELIPGVSSISATAAKLGIALGERDEQIHIIPASYELEESLNYKGSKVYMKAGTCLDKLKKVLSMNEGKLQILAVENCGMNTEKIYRSIEELGDATSYFTTIIVKDENNI